MAIAENIAKLRKAKGYTQAELAEKLGIAQPNVAQYEKGGEDDAKRSKIQFSKYTV